MTAHAFDLPGRVRSTVGMVEDRTEYWREVGQSWSDYIAAERRRAGIRTLLDMEEEAMNAHIDALCRDRAEIDALSERIEAAFARSVSL